MRILTAALLGIAVLELLFAFVILRLTIATRRAQARQLGSILEEFATKLRSELETAIADQAFDASADTQPDLVGHVRGEAGPADMLAGVAGTIRRRMHADAAAVVVSADDDVDAIRAADGFVADELPRFLSLIPLRPPPGNVVAVQPRSRDAEPAPATTSWNSTGLALPLELHFDGSLVTFVVAWRDGEGQPTDEDVRAIQSVARETLPVVESAYRLARIDGLVDADQLTGLQDRRSFDDALDREDDLARRYDRHLSLVILDVDKFKTINERFGHDTGDRVLQVVAESLRETASAGDMAFRIGADEFAVLLPDLGLAAADQLYERLRRAVQRQRSFLDRPVTVSAGIAELLPDEHGASFVQRADAALLAAKRMV